MPAKPTTIDEYVDALPEPVREILEEIRRRAHRTLPDAGERISYQIPTITLGGRSVVHFAAWKHHVAVYPVPAADDAFARELAPYAGDKGTLRFPLNQPIPYDLIERVVGLLGAQRAADLG